MAKKNDVLSLDEENEQRARYAGMTLDEIAAAASAIESQKHAAAEASGDLSAKLEIFQKKGGHKKMLKWAKEITDLEPAECHDAMRAFNAYFDALGGNDQLDMFAVELENRKKMDSIGSANTAAASPQIGAEATAH